MTMDEAMKAAERIYGEVAVRDGVVQTPTPKAIVETVVRLLVEMKVIALDSKD